MHDDLDAVLDRLVEVRAGDLYVMRPERLTAPSSGLTPAYYRGRSAATWQQAVRRATPGVPRRADHHEVDVVERAER